MRYLRGKKGGGPIDQKKKKCKKGKYILMNPARFASHHRVVHVWFTPLRNYAPRGARLRARLKEGEEGEEGEEEEEEEEEEEQNLIW